MSECPYYRTKRIEIKSREMRPDRQQTAPSIRIRAWCEHPNHSPVDMKTAIKTIGGQKLQCNGEYTQCPLTPEQIADIA